MSSKLCSLLVAALLLVFSTGCQQGGDAPHAGETAEEHAGHSPSDGHAESDGHDHGVEEEGHDHEDGDEHGHDEHGHDEHGDHAGHDHAHLISLSPEQMKQFGVKTAVAGAGKLDIYLTLPGEAAVNQDTVGHVLPKLGGVVKSVSRNIGDDVRRGDLLVVIESRELASAKADYLAAKERESIALATQEREKMLAEQGVSPEQDYINATNALREIQVQVRAAAQALHALGVSEGQLAKLSASSSDSLTRYEVYAPLSGRVLEKHASIGEVVDTASELFLIADLSTVWINLNVSQKDLPRVQEGQSVRIRFSPSAAADPSSLPPADSGIADATGRIKYIDALLSEDTRTAQARIVLPNPRGLWKPGMFVTGLVTVESAGVSVLVPLEALIKFEGAQTVFVQDSDGFEPRTVVLGRQSATHAEVLSGLEAGETYVVQGAFTVKAELGKSEAGHGH